MRVAAMIPPFVLLIAVQAIQGAEDRAAALGYAELVKQHTDAQNKYVAALYRAKNLQQAHEALPLMPSTAEFAGKFLEIARKDPASEDALNAILWILTYSPGGPSADECYRLLAQHHLDNKRVVGAIRPVMNWPSHEGEAFVRAAMAQSKLDAVKADACYTLATITAARARREGGTDAGRASYDEAETLFKTLASAYGTLKLGTTPLAELSRGGLAKLGSKPRAGERAPRVEEGVDVGDKAPEIAGANTKGESTRLSGYEGSVVVLAFWGQWCPWCHSIYPFGRDLNYRAGGKPLVLLGVNSDGSPEQLRQVMAAEQIDWPSWWDGRGPIARQFGIDRWPATFVLDHRGVIRFKMTGVVDEESLSSAVNTLLDEQARDPNVNAKVQAQAKKAPTPKKTAKKKGRR